MPAAPEPPRSLVDDLVSQGVCTPEVVEAVTRQLVANGGGRLTDALAVLGWADERAVLRVLALRANTRFVTIEKLRAAKVEQSVLDRVPVRFAEAHSALPLKYDEPTKALLVAAADPTDPAFLTDLKIVSSLQNIVVLVALERGVHAAIRRFYYGDVTAFESLARELTPVRSSSSGRDTQEASLSKIFKTPLPKP
ncbi:MAG: GspE/PulE/PilB domain-containing protein [Myxococcales bacterium]